MKLKKVLPNISFINDINTGAFTILSFPQYQQKINTFYHINQVSCRPANMLSRLKDKIV